MLEDRTIVPRRFGQAELMEETERIEALIPWWGAADSPLNTSSPRSVLSAQSSSDATLNPVDSLTTVAKCTAIAGIDTAQICLGVSNPLGEYSPPSNSQPFKDRLLSFGVNTCTFVSGAALTVSGLSCTMVALEYIVAQAPTPIFMAVAAGAGAVGVAGMTIQQKLMNSLVALRLADRVG